MVHSKPEYAESTKLLTYSQLRSLEKIDKKKAEEQALAEVGKQAVSTAGDVATSSLTALAAFATGPGGYLIALLAIHYFEKIQRLKVKTGNLIVSYQPVYTNYTAPGLGGATIGATIGGASTPQVIVSYGPTQTVTLTQDQLNQFENDPNYRVTSIQPEYSMEGLLDTSEAELAKSLLTTAAAAGVAGNLLGGLFGRK